MKTLVEERTLLIEVEVALGFLVHLAQTYGHWLPDQEGRVTPDNIGTVYMLELIRALRRQDLVDAADIRSELELAAGLPIQGKVVELVVANLVSHLRAFQVAPAPVARELEPAAAG